MIAVYRRENSLTVRGHAGYAAPGKDIVCAAVSALVETMIAAIEQVTTDHIRTNKATGLVDITWERLSDRGLLLIDAFFVGIKMLSDQYPEHIRIV